MVLIHITRLIISSLAASGDNVSGWGYICHPLLTTGGGYFGTLTLPKRCHLGGNDWSERNLNFVTPTMPKWQLLVTTRVG